MKAGIIGVDCFLSKGGFLFGFETPLRCVCSIPPLTPLAEPWPFVKGGISMDGESEGLVSEGVSTCREVEVEVVLELARE